MALGIALTDIGQKTVKAGQALPVTVSARPGTVKAGAELVLLWADILLVLTCSLLHFLRGTEHNGGLHGGLTLAFFFIAGFTTNLFHYFRHESQRMAQRTACQKVTKILLILLPCYYLVLWSFMSCTRTDSLTIKCWTASLRLFYCSLGSLVQAVFQSYVVIDLWYLPEGTIPDAHYVLVMAAAVFLTLHAVYGVCRYTWINYHDEMHLYMLPWNFICIIFVLFFNISGRVVAMAIVTGTVGGWWLVLAVGVPFLINYAAYSYEASKADTTGHDVCRYVFLVPLALLSAITVSDQRVLTVITTLTWLACSLPHIIRYHQEVSNWLPWVIPAVAQIVALLTMMIKWSVFEATFQRFPRLARFNQWTAVPTKENLKPYETA
ncbi:hypothetical protein GWK47_038672 [Chionoecetes opilio]|uniref:Uncharacterized protein n=1 Tax=Chionoecetes opilio TaxID=41210 RepID=A0A8J4YCC1_CHIOP|nr:hypothetical protein GWK47_038672 [Chionoecetes opilio]